MPISIQGIELGSNTLDTGAVATIKVTVIKIDSSSVISCSDNTVCGNYSCGQQINSSSVLQP